MKILRAEPDDWQHVRDFRLRALLDTPDAFGSTYAQEAVESEDAWWSWATGWPRAVEAAHVLRRWKKPEHRAWFAGCMRIAAEMVENHLETKLPMLELSRTTVRRLKEQQVP